MKQNLEKVIKMDKITKEQRSKIMSKIRNKWTSPEKLLHNKLKGLKIKHKMHPAIYGKPDILLNSSKTVIFIDGCFWHGCHTCNNKKPSTNKKFWINKIKKNIKRDAHVIRRLKKDGFKIIRIWEHDIKNNFPNLMGKIKVMA